MVDLQNTPFKVMLKSIQHHHLSNELVAVRDEIMGSLQFTHLYNGGHISPDMFARPYDSPASSPTFKLFRSMCTYIQEAAWGEACLRYKGDLPSPKQPLKASITAALRASKPDWRRICDVNPDSDMAISVQKKLGYMCEAFAGLADLGFQMLEFPRNDLLYQIPQPTIDAAIATVLPLKAAHRSEAMHGGASPPSVELLHEYQVRGAHVRNILGYNIRSGANGEFTRSSKLVYEAQAKGFIGSIRLYNLATSAPQHADVAFANMAAIALLMKIHAQVVENADSALAALQFKITQPIFYKDRRASAVRFFQIFEGSELPWKPDWPIAKRSAAQLKADKSLSWKVLCRKARGHAGLCLERLDQAHAGLSLRDSDTAMESYQAAEKAFRDAFEADPSDHTPMRELEQLDREMMGHLGTARLLKHARHKPNDIIASSPIAAEAL